MASGGCRAFEQRGQSLWLFSITRDPLFADAAPSVALAEPVPTTGGVVSIFRG